MLCTLIGTSVYAFREVILGDNQEALVRQFKGSLHLTTSNKGKRKVQKKVSRIVLDVPLVNQMTEPRLYNGCEVTSLTMLLNYNKIDVSKNVLADEINTVPLNYDDGEHGNPNIGFVGDITGSSAGLGVYHGPITKLARKYSKNVKDISGQNFNKVIEQLELKHPVWTITTVSFARVNDFQDWQTPQGDMQITFSEHSVVITGFDRKNNLIYINNPYGTKNQAVNWDNFEEAYNQMGKQAVYINSQK
ncbi:YvpB like protein [Liquorilactobacillus oeni DSM 19972]|uniref:YvpB like protein n=2 Tax=Liquorilactobacillus oeni TaxID=303241 RepID=A0A0R1M6V6_9LACO|nr:C39 family peptidase [Liquorilactobacillus oeni]KRL04013.1 YvpB like protein [Liquorilactobacillus oeni DSM 19972]